MVRWRPPYCANLEFERKVIELAADFYQSRTEGSFYLPYPSSLDDGNRLLFECQLISRPRPTVKWYKENRQITDYDQRITTKLKEFQPNRYLATLDINDVVGIDAGVYRIHAVNMQGDVSASINLNFTRNAFFLLF